MKTITNFKSIFSFETERLLFKKIESNDLNHLIHMDTDSTVMNTLGGVRSAAQTAEGLQSNLNHWQEHGFGAWMVYLKQTDEWIGRSALRHVIVDGKNEIEVAYALLPTFWNQGLATEIAKACIEIAFSAMQFEQIICFTSTTNKASQRVMEKAGFQYERDIMHAGLPHVLYRIKLK